MKNFFRFEVFLPELYRVSSRGAQDVRIIDPELISEFQESVRQLLETFTEVDPQSAPNYRTPLVSATEDEIIVDQLIYLFGNVTADRIEEAERHFAHWKRRIDQRTTHNVVRIIYYRIKVIGEFPTNGNPLITHPAF